MRTLAIVNQKGGSGKTTTAINLAAIFAARGMRTLLVDMDPQAHCAVGLGVPEDRIDYSIADALIDTNFDADALIWEVSRNLDLAPSTMRLARLEAPGGGLHEREDKDRRLLKVLRSLAERYDRCVIDCPPTIGMLTYNAMRAAREALIPVETGYLAMKGAQRQWQTIRNLIERIDRSIAVHLLPTLHDPESRTCVEVLTALRRNFAGQILPMVIHRHEALREAISFGQPIVEYAPDSKARLDYERLVEWLEAHAPATQSGQLRVQQQAAFTPGWERAANRTNSEQHASANTHAPLKDPNPIAPLPETSREIPLETAQGHGLTPSSRAAEMVQRVRAMAERTQQYTADVDRMVKQALQDDDEQDDRPGGPASHPSAHTQSVDAPTALADVQRNEKHSAADGDQWLDHALAGGMELSLDLASQHVWLQAQYTAEQELPADLDTAKISAPATTADQLSKTAAPAPMIVLPVRERVNCESENEADATLPVSRTAHLSDRSSAASHTDADSDDCIDHRLPQRPALVIDPADTSAAEAEPTTDRSAKHLFGVRQTSTGVLFVQPAHAGQSIAVAGQFNNWSPTAHPLRLNPQLMLWEAVIPMKPGRYAYRLVVDGDWRIDPYNERVEADRYGEQQSIVAVHPQSERSAVAQQIHHPIVHVQTGSGPVLEKRLASHPETRFSSQAIR